MNFASYSIYIYLLIISKLGYLLVLHVIMSIAQMEDKEANQSQLVTKTIRKHGRKSMQNLAWVGGTTVQSGMWSKCQKSYFLC